MVAVEALSWEGAAAPSENGPSATTVTVAGTGTASAEKARRRAHAASDWSLISAWRVPCRVNAQWDEGFGGCERIGTMRCSPRRSRARHAASYLTKLRFTRSSYGHCAKIGLISESLSGRPAAQGRAATSRRRSSSTSTSSPDASFPTRCHASAVSSTAWTTPRSISPLTAPPPPAPPKT